MKKRLASLLTVLMMLCMTVGAAVTASANTQVPVTLNNLKIGDYQDDTTGYTQFTQPISSNTNIARAELVGNRVRITGVAVGTTNVKYSALKASTTAGGVGNWEDVTVTVTVVANTTSGTGAAGSESLTVAANGGTTTTNATYDNVTNMGSSNSGMATATYDSSSKKITVKGVSIGTATISFTYTESGVVKNGTLTITITSAGAVGSGQPLAVGGIYNGSQHYEIIDATSSNTGVVTVAVDRTTTGAHKYTVTGVSTGNADVIVKYRDAAGGAETSKTEKFTVGTPGATTPSTAPSVVAAETVKVASSKIPGNTEEKGIYFAKTRFDIEMGKSNTIGSKIIKLDGKTIKPSVLRWVAENPEIISVNMQSGAFKGLKAGESKLFAVDINGKYLNSVTITVK
jgi:hypothetical protein